MHDMSLEISQVFLLLEQNHVKAMFSSMWKKRKKQTLADN
jgi:hypothetical protein